MSDYGDSTQCIWEISVFRSVKSEKTDFYRWESDCQSKWSMLKYKNGRFITF